MKNKFLNLLLVITLLLSFTATSLAATGEPIDYDKRLSTIMSRDNFESKYTELGAEVKFFRRNTDTEEIKRREEALDQDREYIQELVDKFTIDRFNMRDNSYDSFVSLVLANASAFISKELKITYGGDSSNQVGDVRKGNSMCYGINIIMQELLAKYGVPSRLVFFGYENEDGGLLVDVKILDKETGKVKTEPMIGHCSLLIPSGRGSSFIDATNIISNPDRPSDFMRVLTTDTEMETMAKAMANYAAPQVYGERKPKYITSMILPWYIGNGKYVGQTVSYYRMRYSAVENFAEDGLYYRFEW